MLRCIRCYQKFKYLIAIQNTNWNWQGIPSGWVGVHIQLDCIHRQSVKSTPECADVLPSHILQYNFSLTSGKAMKANVYQCKWRDHAWNTKHLGTIYAMWTEWAWSYLPQRDFMILGIILQLNSTEFNCPILLVFASQKYGIYPFPEM